MYKILLYVGTYLFSDRKQQVLRLNVSQLRYNTNNKLMSVYKYNSINDTMATLIIDCRTVAILIMLFRLKTVIAKTFGLGSPLHLNRHTSIILVLQT